MENVSMVLQDLDNELALTKGDIRAVKDKVAELEQEMKLLKDALNSTILEMKVTLDAHWTKYEKLVQEQTGSMEKLTSAINSNFGQLVTALSGKESLPLQAGKWMVIVFMAILIPLVAALIYATTGLKVPLTPLSGLAP